MRAFAVFAAAVAVVGLCGALLVFARARVERDRAVAEQRVASALAGSEDVEATVRQAWTEAALEQAQRSNERLLAYVGQMFSDPEADPGGDRAPGLRRLLDVEVERARAELEGLPAARARVLAVLARLYEADGAAARAAELRAEVQPAEAAGAPR